MSQLLVEVVEGPDAGKQVVLQRPVEIGRDPDVDLVLSDSQVSRRHARLSPDGAAAVLEDLGSSNGSFANHNEIMGPARVTDGDEILVGVSVLQLRSTGGDGAEQRSGVRAVPPALARPEAKPTYKQAGDRRAGAKVPELEVLRDQRVRQQAKLAPLAILLLVVLVVVIYLGVVN